MSKPHTISHAIHSVRKKHTENFLRNFKMSVDSTRLSNVVSHVADACGIKKWHYVKTPLSNTAQNYFGELIPATIKSDDKKDWTLGVLMKFAPMTHKLRECGVVNNLYCKEIYVYASLKPDFEELTTNVNVSQLIPECYYVDKTANQEVLVLKDMRCEGFVRYDYGMFMDVDHVKISLEALAKFHALSYILKLKKPDVVEDHNNHLKPFGYDRTAEFTLYMRNTLKNLMTMFEGTKYENVIGNVADNLDSGFSNEATIANRFVYGHGDVWKENILFKYENNKPQHACLIDFQLCRVMSPAFDVLYFILNSTEASTRRPYFHQFLYFYYNTLQRVLRENHISAQAVYSEKEFQEDLKSVSSICFPFIQFAFSLWLGLEENSVLTSKSPCLDEKDKESKKSYYKKIIMDIIDDLEYFELM